MYYFTSDEGLEFIKSFESFSPTTYICPAGHMTIGYGHVLNQGEHYQGLSMEMADKLLRRDLVYAENAVRRNINKLSGQNQFDALVSLTYNIGGGALQRSTLRQKINYGASLGEVVQEFMRWIYANGRKLSGLMRRRFAESQMFAYAKSSPIFYTY